MNKTKNRILNAARNLFNEHGYSQVTIRMIALKLEMSSGNLNYHYKKREDILEALYFEMVAEFDKRVKQLPQTSISISQIRRDILSSIQRMIEYKFFWTDLYNLLKKSDQISKHFQKVYDSRINGYFYLFKKLEKQNLLQPPAFPNEHQLIADLMINFSNTWIYSTNIYRRKNDTIDIEDQANRLLGILYPYLTIQGKKELAVLASGFFSDEVK